MTTLTPEQRQEVEKAGNEPVTLEDPQTHEQYVLLKADIYELLRRAVEDEQLRVLLRDEIPDDYRTEGPPAQPIDPPVDRTFREGWETPEMAEYDEYEKHRP